MPDTPYDRIADWYDAAVETQPIYREVILPSLLGLVGEVAGQRVLDVACGQGFVSRALARRGARVTGVDISTRLLVLAREREAREPLGIDYREGDAQTLDGFADASFDGASCGMALMNVPDLAACARAVARVLAPGGWFVATITHPCFQTPHSEWLTLPDGTVARTVRDYASERFWESTGASGVRGRVGEHHRTLASYVNTFSNAGFLLERLDEPLATGERAAHAPGERAVPSILTLRFRRGGSQ